MDELPDAVWGQRRFCYLHAIIWKCVYCIHYGRHDTLYTSFANSFGSRGTKDILSKQRYRYKIAALLLVCDSFSFDSRFAGDEAVLYHVEGLCVAG
jgi:hypothetical protein